MNEYYLLTLCIGILIIFLATSRKKGTKFPVVPGAYPILGNLINVDNLPDQLDDWSSKYGICEFRMLGKKWVIVADATELKTLSRQRPRQIQRFKPLRRALDDVAPGVFGAELPQWSLERRLMTPAFNHSNLTNFLPGLHKCCDSLVAAVRKEGGNNFIMLAARYTADVIGLVSFGQELESLNNPNSDIADVFKKLLHATTKRMLTPLPLWRIPILGPILDHFNGISSLKRRQNLTCEKILAQANPDNGYSILDKMVHLNRKENTKLSNIRLIGNLATLYIAGSETTATTMSWMLYFLAKFPDFQEEARRECFANSFDQFTTFKQALEAYPHLRSLFWECLRFYGPASFMLLENSQNTIQVADRTLDPNEYVLVVPLRWLAKQPQIGGSTFDPRRWLVSSSSTLNSKPSLLDPLPENLTLPFGFGVRICPGKDLAELEACTACAALLKAYDKIELVNPEEPQPSPTFQFAMIPDRPINLRFIQSTFTK